jgi:YbgC/YbaW family acyl-CoA thioester hydrolase
VTAATPPRIRTEVQAMFFDTDCGGVVSNIAYLRFIELARTLLAEELGLALTEIAETQRYPVVVRTEIDYRRAAKLGDRLVIEGWLDQLERVRFWCAFRIVRPKDNTLIAECRQTLALIEMPAGKLLQLPEAWKKYRKPEADARSPLRDAPRPARTA